MPISKRRKEELAIKHLPNDHEIIKRMRTFMLRTGLSAAEFADASGYNKGTVSRFLSGNYAGDTSEFRADAKEMMDLHDLTEANRLDAPHYRTKAFNTVRTAAFNALRNGVAYIVDGPPGTEKTESFRRIEAEINRSGNGRAVYVYTRISHSPKAFLSEVCAAAGIPNHGNIDPLIRKLRFFLGKSRVLLIIDEAQHLGHDGLEVLRQLLDLPPYFGVMLGGSHDLTQRLRHWQMEQWRSRVRQTICMSGPTEAEARTILRAELGDVTDEECDETIAACRSTAERTELVRGKLTAKPYTYISARDLFGAIETAQQDSLHVVPAPVSSPAQINQENAA
jgi:DNA transposition AAA+ family ATPase